MDKVTKPVIGYNKVFKKKKKPLPSASANTVVPVASAVIATQLSPKDLSSKDADVGAKECASAEDISAVAGVVIAKEATSADLVVGAKEGSAAVAVVV